MKLRRLIAACMAAAMLIPAGISASAAETQLSGAPSGDDAGITVLKELNNNNEEPEERNSIGQKIWYTTKNPDYRISFANGNIDRNNYYVWTEPVNSYLHICDDGSIMRFEAPETEYYLHDGNFDKFDFRCIAEYYDQNYSLIRSVRIEPELLLFGGFYSSKDNCCIVTGRR